MGCILRLSRYPILMYLILAVVCIPHSEASTNPVERKGLSTIGEIIFVTGKVMVRLIPEESYSSAVPRQELVPGDIIKTGPNGRSSILLKDETQLKIASNTTLVIKEVTSQKEKAGALKTLLKLESGEVWTRSKGVSEGLTIETPTATAAIRGTEWSLFVKGNESRVVVMEGNVQLANKSGAVIVGKNEQAVVVGDQAPVKSIIISPRDRIQWTYYLSEKRLLGFLKFKSNPHPLDAAKTLFNSGRIEESAQAFEDILSKEPDNPTALTGIGLIELKKGNMEKAKEYFDRSLKIKKNLLSLLGKSFIAISDNMIEEADAILRSAKEAFPKEPLPYIFSAYLYTFQGAFHEAVNECDRGLSAIPDDPLILSFKADIYFILNKQEDVKATIDTLLKSNPDSSEGYEKLGFYHRIVTGDSKKAKEAFKKAISLDPLNDEAKAKLAEILREQGYIHEARQLIEDALSISPWNAMHHYNYGRLLADIDRIDEAKEQFRKAISLDTTFSRAYLGEGIVLLKEGKTNEALKELSKASILEPNLSEIHSFLAIAYYQKHNIPAAIDELRRAQECDPLDSTPHQLLASIYNDLYMPVEAIEESRKVIELLPYRKASGEALLESAKSGTMSVNEGLKFIDLPEWSLYYAQKALFINPYSNNTHFGVAIAYESLGKISALQGYNEFDIPAYSEYIQAFSLNIRNSLNASNRYRNLISKPGHYLTFGSGYAKGDSEEKWGDITASGDFGSRFPFSYWLYSSIYSDTGVLKNWQHRDINSRFTFGYKPRYDHDIFLDIGIDDSRGGASQFDNLKYVEKDWWVQTGYHKRFSPVSHLITSLRYIKWNNNIVNPDVDEDWWITNYSGSGDRYRDIAFGIKHMFTTNDSHQISYGIDLNDFKRWSYDNYPIVLHLWTQQDSTYLSLRSAVLYAYDRWTVVPRITLDTGLFLTYYSTNTKSQWRDNVWGTDTYYYVDDERRYISPRVGITIDLGKGVFRIAYQDKGGGWALGSLAPIGVSGLVPPTFERQFNESRDIQASVEYELFKDTFVKLLGGYQRLNDLGTLSSGDNKEAQLWYSRIAVNQILSRYFSFSARYHHNNSRYLDGSGRDVMGVPVHSADARLVFVHPRQWYLWLGQSYIGERFADTNNDIKLKKYHLTDFYAEKQFFNKRLFMSFSVNNIFNKQYTDSGFRLGRGTTFIFRIEYRV